MRSQQVYAAAVHVENRYLLCNLLRVSTRKIHKFGCPMQQTISQVLGLIDKDSCRHAGLETKTAIAVKKVSLREDQAEMRKAS